MRAYHRLASPQYFFQDVRIWVTVLYVISVVGLIVGSVWGLFFVPPERFQGDSFRIMFVHVPTAHLAQVIYIAIAIAGAIHLIWKLKMADVFMVAAAPVGCIMTVIALLTGMLWGMPTWGTAWVWDARTTSMLVLFVLFFAIIALRNAIPNPNRATFAVSVLAIIGFANIPLIKFSVEWFATLHQPASITLDSESSIAPIFLVPLLTNIASAYLFAAATILAGMRFLVLRRNQGTEWVQQWLKTQNL